MKNESEINASILAAIRGAAHIPTSLHAEVLNAIAWEIRRYRERIAGPRGAAVKQLRALAAAVDGLNAAAVCKLALACEKSGVEFPSLGVLRRALEASIPAPRDAAGRPEGKINDPPDFRFFLALWAIFNLWLPAPVTDEQLEQGEMITYSLAERIKYGEAIGVTDAQGEKLRLWLADPPARTPALHCQRDGAKRETEFAKFFIPIYCAIRDVASMSPTRLERRAARNRTSASKRR